MPERGMVPSAGIPVRDTVLSEGDALWVGVLSFGGKSVFCCVLLFTDVPEVSSFVCAFAFMLSSGFDILDEFFIYVLLDFLLLIYADLI